MVLVRIPIILALCLAVSGCLGFGKKTQVAAPVEAPPDTSACYTVVLFDEFQIEQPASDVPAAYRRFLGDWGFGAWNDVWCHDLLITKVHADGRAELIEMHAPYLRWGQPATAFKRVGRIDYQGTLRIAYGGELLSYRVVDGALIGQRSGKLGNLTATLTRRDMPPLPPRRPAHLVLAARPTALPPGT